MRKQGLLVVALLTGTVGIAVAQTPGKTPGPSPVASAKGDAKGAPPISNEVNGKMRQAMELIHKDLHSGKITKAQADSDKAQVLAVRKQELADFKANGKHELTDAQKSQINASLDGIISGL